MSDPFLAEVIIFAGNFAPRGWAFCEGQLLPIAQYQAVFSLVGTIYGGDGRTTFALPDLRGRTPISPGTGPGLPNYRVGQRGGNYQHTLTVNELASHNHTAVVTIKAADGNADQDKAKNNALAKNTDGSQIYNDAATFAANNALNAGSATATIGNTGGQQSFNIMNPYLAMYYIFALQGTYPSRN